MNFKTLTNLSVKHLNPNSRTVGKVFKVSNDLEFTLIGKGSFRNVYSVRIKGIEQDYVLKLNKSLRYMNCNLVEILNFKLFESLGYKSVLVPILYFNISTSVLIMEKVVTVNAARISRFSYFEKKAYYLLENIQHLVKLNLPKKVKIRKYCFDRLDITANNVSECGRLFDYGLPLEVIE